MYVLGMGFRAIERVKKVHHTTIIYWVKQVGQAIPAYPPTQKIPEVTEVDELETFVGKNNKIWLWTAVNHSKPGILAWIVGDRSAETFKQLWLVVKCRGCYFFVTDGYKVYPCFIEDADHIVSKTYMTRVEGENSRLRHYLARLHRKTLCYSLDSRNAVNIS